MSIDTLYADLGPEEREAMIARRFRNRRRIAWLAFILLAGVQAAAAVAFVTTGAGGDVLIHGLWLDAAIVGAYIGAAILEHMRSPL